MTLADFQARWAGHSPQVQDVKRAYAVLAPLVEGPEGLSLLFEVRADTLSQAGEYILAMFCPRYELTYSMTELLGRRCILTAVIGILFAGVLPERFAKKLADNGTLRMIYVPALLFLCFLMLASDAYNPFIYFRF